MPDLAPYVKPTAQVEPYVEVLGQELAVKFLLAFGGAEIGLVSSGPTARSRVAKVIGPDATFALMQISHRLQRRVPLASQWLAAVLKAQGTSHQEIARILRITDVSVRNYISRYEADLEKAPRKSDHDDDPGPDQLDLPLF